jgi:hypothetical protein
MKTIVRDEGFPEMYAHFKHPQRLVTEYCSYFAPPEHRSGRKRIGFSPSRLQLQPAERASVSGTSGKANGGKMPAAKRFAVAA